MALFCHHSTTSSPRHLTTSMDNLGERLFALLLFIPAVVSALTVHEFAHAWMAHRLGDDLARRQGRLTLDPLAHLDPFGSLMFVIAALSGFPLLAWAKPVPFDPRNLSHPRRDSMLIAIAGPISNLLQAPIWLLALWIFRMVAERSGAQFGIDELIGILSRSPDINSTPVIIATVLASGFVINVLLAAFNMIPIPPLDGHYILEGLGPPFITDFYNAIRPFGFMILFVLIQTPVIGMLIGPFSDMAYRVVSRAVGVPI
jgi:Zn-dependent protease